MSLSKEQMLNLVQGQLAAYNERNLEKFCQFFDENIEAFDLENNRKILQGMSEFRVVYQRRFSGSPQLHCELKSRVILESSILDEEWVTGIEGAQKPSHVVAIYNFNEHKINRVFFTK